MQEQSSCLIDKVCTPCQGGVDSLNSAASSKLLLELNNGWIINELGHLYKEYNFSNFIDAIKLANKIAESEAHHPNLEICWGKCAVRI